MGLLDFFLGRKPQTAGIAKERLQIVLAHERASRDAPEFLPQLQSELLAVVAKYVSVKEDLIQVKIGRQGDSSSIEINIEIDPNAAKPRPKIEAAKSAVTKPGLPVKVAAPRTKTVSKRH